jgi:Mg2+-importing ATPase
LNALLLSLATASYFLGDLRAAIVILVMVVLAITTTLVQEHRSNDAAAKLRAMVKTTASVKLRGAAVATEDQSQGFVEIAIDQLVPGDLVRLSAGDMIPADLRLISAKDLFVNQSALTGEAMPSEKSALPVIGETADHPFDLSILSG